MVHSYNHIRDENVYKSEQRMQFPKSVSVRNVRSRQGLLLSTANEHSQRLLAACIRTPFYVDQRKKGRDRSYRYMWPLMRIDIIGRVEEYVAAGERTQFDELQPFIFQTT